MTMQKIQIANDTIKFTNNKTCTDRNSVDDERYQYNDMYTFAKEQLRDLQQLEYLQNKIQILNNGNKTNSDSKKIAVQIVTVFTKNNWNEATKQQATNHRTNTATSQTISK